MSVDASVARAVESAAAAAWDDFLSNRIWHAERRASGWLTLLREQLSAQPQKEMSGRDEDLLVALADLAHIAGAARGDDAMLRLALDAYGRVPPTPPQPNVLRMIAESLLRLRDYPAAFAAFDRIAALDPKPADVAPFRLLHDAECVEAAVRLGADDRLLERCRAWRQLAAELGDAPLTPQRQLSAAQRELLGVEYGRPLPVPPSERIPRWAGADSMLRPRDWGTVGAQYAAEKVAVIDELFTAETLAALQAYARHGAPFLTMRNGYLGAFPADGNTHALLLALVQALVGAAPGIFGKHALGLWWLFKYGEANPDGIGIHADAATVNVNIWLTADDACLDGGGLALYQHVPALEQPTQAINREFASAAEEATLREQLTAGGNVLRIPYRCNRAVVFVSDQYHESLPFRFAAGYENRRVNLTLLFGDRWSQSRDDGGAATSESAPGAAQAQADAWSVFD
jgi:hypothetical protein